MTNDESRRLGRSSKARERERERPIDRSVSVKLLAARPSRASKSRRIIVPATGRERGFTESLAEFPEKSRGKGSRDGGGGEEKASREERARRSETKEGR